MTLTVLNKSWLCRVLLPKFYPPKIVWTKSLLWKPPHSSKCSIRIKYLNTHLQIFKIYLFFAVSTAGCRRSRKDQPGVPGWEKRPGCDLLWPEALLWQYLSGAAVCGFWLSVAPSLWAQGGTAQTWSALLHYRGGPGSWRWHQHGKGSGAGLFVNLSHIHWPCHTRKSFSKVFFLVFLNPAAENSKTKKKRKRTNMEAVTNKYDDIF